MAETRIEEAGIVDAKFADEWIVRRHLCCIVGRHMNRFTRDKDVELVRIKNEFAAPADVKRLPKVVNFLGGPLVDVDHRSVMFAASSDQAVAFPAEIDGEGGAPICAARCLGGNERLAVMQRLQFVLVQQWLALAEADLRKARARADDDRESARADLKEQLSLIAGRDLVEFLRPVGHDTREDVEAAGGAFRVGRSRDIRRKREVLGQRHDVNAAGLKNRAGLGQLHLVQLQPIEFFENGAVRAWKEGRAHTIGLRAKAKVQTGRLDLVSIKGTRRGHGTCVKKCSYVAIRQNTRLTHVKTSCLTGEV